MADKLFIRDRGTPSNPGAADYLRQQIARLKAEEPQPPPEVIAYRKRYSAWKREIDRLRSNLIDAMTKRYEVCRDEGVCTVILGNADTWKEAEQIKREKA